MTSTPTRGADPAARAQQAGSITLNAVSYNRGPSLHGRTLFQAAQYPVQQLIPNDSPADVRLKRAAVIEVMLEPEKQSRSPAPPQLPLNARRSEEE